MSYIATKKTPEKFLPKLRNMSAYDIYLNQVRSVIEPIRYQNRDMSYLPPQLGGLAGQRKTLDQALVMQIIDFEVNE